MGFYNIGEDAAIGMLQDLSQRANTKLYLLAQDLLAAAGVPETWARAIGSFFPSAQLPPTGHGLGKRKGRHR